MPAIAFFIAAILTSMTIGLFAFGLIAGRSNLLWLANQPVVGDLVSRIVTFTGVMRFGDGIAGNFLCYVMLIILVPVFLGFVTWVFMVMDQIAVALFKSRPTSSAKS